MNFKAVVLGLVAVAPLVSSSQVYTFRYAKSWGGALADGFTDVALDASGNAYAVGFTTVAANSTQLIVVKYSTTGTVLWSRSNIGAVSSQNALIALTNSGDVAVVRKEGVSIKWELLSSSTGATLTSRSDSFSDGSIKDLEPHAPTNSLILLFQGSPSSSINEFKVASYDDSSLGLNWDTKLSSQAPPASKLAVAADGGLYVGRNIGSVNEVRRMDPATGATLWSTSMAHSNGQFRFDLAILNGTFNPIVTNNDSNAGSVKLLSKNTGSVSRTDSFTDPVIALMPGLAATYTASRQSTSITHMGVFAKGEQVSLGSTGFILGAFAADATGQAHGAGFLGQTPNSLTDLGVRHAGSQRLGLTPDTFSSGAALAVETVGARVVAVGHVASGVNQQARIVHFTQNRFASQDSYGFRFDTQLKVPAPGVKMNDSLANNAAVTLVSPPTHGTLTLDSDGSFTYQPDAGSRAQDTFSYRIGPNANDVATVSLTNFAPSALVAFQGSVVGGTPIEMGLSISPTTLVAVPVSITDNATGVAFPGSVSVPPGESNAFFSGVTVGVAANQNVTTTANLDGESVTATFTILAATPASLTLNPTALVGGHGFVGTITGSGPANSSGYAISITHSGTEISTPINVFMSGGSTTVNFNGTTIARSTSVTHTVTATARGVSKSASLTINPGGLFALTVAPTSIKGGTNAQGKVQTAGLAPAGGTLVAVSADGPQVTVPPTVTVDAGQQFKTFVVTSTAVSSTTPRTIIASFGTVIKTTTLTLTP